MLVIDETLYKILIEDIVRIGGTTYSVRAYVHFDWDWLPHLVPAEVRYQNMLFKYITPIETYKITHEEYLSIRDVALPVLIMYKTEFLCTIEELHN